MVFYFLEFDATTDIPSEHVLEDRLKNSFRSLQNKRTHSITAVCSFTPIPNYNVDDFVLRGAGRRRVSDYFAAVCTQLFHVQLCERGKGGGLQHIWRPEHVRLF